MTGIHGDLFDLDGNSKLDIVEQAEDFLVFECMMDYGKDEISLSSLSGFDE